MKPCDHVTPCPRCHRPCCESCLCLCAGCNEFLCAGCARLCDRCGLILCHDCFGDDGSLCFPCLTGEREIPEPEMIE